MRLPQSLERVSGAVTAANDLVKAATEEADETAAALAVAETEGVKRAMGVGPGSRQPSGAAAELKDLEKDQKRRATRAKRDGIDRALVDLAGFYRDVLVVQSGAKVELVNEEMRDTVTAVARASTPETTVRRIDAVLRAREQIDVNVAPLLAVEAMTVGLRRG
jgi:DNA polymerase III subunit delta'